MPVEPEDVVREWLDLAREDIEVARRVHDFPGAAAFHLQQAAEKALKAFLILRGVRPPRSHDLTQLANLAGPSLGWTASLAQMSRLTSWNAAFRYPDVEIADTLDEDALTEAELLVEQLIMSVASHAA